MQKTTHAARYALGFSLVDWSTRARGSHGSTIWRVVIHKNDLPVDTLEGGFKSKQAKLFLSLLVCRNYYTQFKERMCTSSVRLRGRVGDANHGSLHELMEGEDCSVKTGATAFRVKKKSVDCHFFGRQQGYG